VGRTIQGKYRIDEPLGRGAMGVVYKAKQVALGKTIAIKVVNPAHGGDKTFAARLKREAKTASLLDHPNLLRVVDFGQEPDGLLFIAMEFVDGKDLLRVMRDDWPLSPRRIVHIVSQVLAALASAHETGVLHRDLKPENIMVTRGKDEDGRSTDFVKVCDFGIAKVFERTSEERTETNVTTTGTLTAHGVLVGTPEYMSPELVKSEPLDGRSDLYSVGVLLYLMLTGRLPFTAPNAVKLVMKHVEEPPPAPSSIFPKVHKGLEAVCLKALEKSPDARYANAREMRAALRAAIGDAPRTGLDGGGAPTGRATGSTGATTGGAGGPSSGSGVGATSVPSSGPALDMSILHLSSSPQVSSSSGVRAATSSLSELPVISAFGSADSLEFSHPGLAAVGGAPEEQGEQEASPPTEPPRAQARVVVAVVAIVAITVAVCVALLR
jgi:serine/threonine-protein kinase